MRILQPAEWSKPRGFSHGVVVDGPGQWIVLAGQTGGDEKGEYQPDMAGEGGGAVRRGFKNVAWGGGAQTPRTKLPALAAALPRRPCRSPRQGRDRSHRVRANAIATRLSKVR